MIKNIKIVNKNSNCRIVFKKNYVDYYLGKINRENRNVYIIVDIKVKYLLKSIKSNKNIKIIYLNGGEKIKNFDSYIQLCEKLLSLKVNRKSLLVAIGGGTIGDLCGFVASTILRGIEFKLIPTTLLSQVDSSIGGKNGINTFLGKNNIGTFYQASEVIIDTNILKSLSTREIKSGYAEIVKHSLIKDSKFFDWLDKNNEMIPKLDLNKLQIAIYKSILVKLWYVKKDTKEQLTNKNSRSMLNFGHTFGHALESYYKFSSKLNHGEAISIGMVVESFISNKMGYLSNKNYYKILNHFKKTNLKTQDSNIKNDKILKILLNDKKNYNNKINLVLLKNIGNSFFAKNISIEKLRNIIKQI